ncbi:MAG: FecR domain-containing protein [Pirellulaceae bacterium]
MSRYDVLTYRFLDDAGELSPDELDRLIAGLRAEPSRAVLLREQLVVDDLLAQKLTLDRRNFLAQVEQRIADYEQSEDEIDSQVAELRELATIQLQQTAAKSRSSAWAKGLLAVSLAAVVLAILTLPRILPRQAQPVAKVVAVEGAVTVLGNDKSLGLARATTLLAGQQIETPAGGSLEIQYADQTIVRLAGNSLVTLDAHAASGAKRVTLARGQLTADVAPQRVGAMRFTTPHAQATVLGTKLRLTANQADTLLEVVTGKVQLHRPGSSRPILVEANESGLASATRLQHRRLAWPEDPKDLLYAFDPFTRRVPLVKNPATGNMRETPFEAFGAARANELVRVLELSGGYFVSPEAGEDLSKLYRAADGFSLEIVLTPAFPSHEEPARIIALEGAAGIPCFALDQEESEFAFTLQPDGPDGSSSIRFASLGAQQPVHLAITYGGGKLTCYQNGEQVASQDVAPGAVATWQAGPLTIGADSRGQSRWEGSIAAVALYSRQLDQSEVQRNFHQYSAMSVRYRPLNP